MSNLPQPVDPRFPDQKGYVPKPAPWPAPPEVFCRFPRLEGAMFQSLRLGQHPRPEPGQIACLGN